MTRIIILFALLVAPAFADPPAWVVEFNRLAPKRVGVVANNCLPLAQLAERCWSRNGSPGTAYWVTMTEIWGQSKDHIAFVTDDGWAVSGPWCEAYRVDPTRPAREWACGATLCPSCVENRMEVER